MSQKTSVPKTPPDATLVQFFDDLRDTLDRPERNKPAPLFGQIIAVLIFALLPLASIGIANLLIDPAPSTAEASAESKPLKTALKGCEKYPPDSLEKLSCTLKERRTTALTDAAKNSRSLDALTTMQSEINTLLAAQNDEKTKEATEALTRFSQEARMAALLLLWGVLGCATAFYNWRTIRRHWLGVFVDAHGPGLQEPRARVSAVIASLAAAALAIALLLLADISPFEKSADPLNALAQVLTLALFPIALLLALLVPLKAAAASPVAYGFTPKRIILRAPTLVFTLALVLYLPFVAWALIQLELPWGAPSALPSEPVYFWAIVLGIAFLLATVALTAFGTLALALNFPNPRAIDALMNKSGGLSRRFPTKWFKEDAWSAAVATLEDTQRTRLPISDSLSAEGLKTIIQVLLRALSVFIVVSLIVVSLWFDMREIGTNPETSLGKARIEAHDAWLVILGACFSLCLAVLMILPRTRLDPFHTASNMVEKVLEDSASEPEEPDEVKAAKPKSTGIAIFANSRQLSLVVTDQKAEPKPKEEKPEKSPPPKPVEETLRLGASEKKLQSILMSPRVGGVFQDMLGKEFSEKTMNLIALLAPAASTALLNLLK